MNKSLVEVLMSEIKNQCEMVKISVEGINHFQNTENVSANFLWFNVQGLLIATANISKIFWSGERQSKPIEISYLQGILDIKNYSKINSRKFRNFFEHYDRHLIEWGYSEGNRSIVTSSVMYKGAVRGIDPKDTFKIYYTDINAVGFKGKEMYLQPVIREVARILDAINQIDDVYYSYLKENWRNGYEPEPRRNS